MLRVIMFDWGDTVMRNLDYPGPMARWPRVEAMPGIAQVLAGLRPHYHLALATNAADSGADLVREALARVGLACHLQTVMTARELGVAKPDPAFFRAAVQAAGCDPAEAAMVGDSYEADVRGAKAAGLRAIWYNPKATPCPELQPQHDAELRDLGELPAALTGLSRPDVAGCMAMLAAYGAPPQVVAHVRATAAAAYVLATALQARGERLDPLLTHRAGLLHDVAKVAARQGDRNHGELGGEILRAEGQPEIAEIVERHLLHSVLDPAAAPVTWEQKLVYYADKIAEGAGIVPVAQRIEALCGRYPANAALIRRCLPAVLELEAEIARALGLAPEAMLAGVRERLSPAGDDPDCRSL